MTVIVKKPKRTYFPNWRNIKSQVVQNDPGNPINRRRLRIDPTKDGYDPGTSDDPTKDDNSNSGLEAPGNVPV